jgi:hypothetical protein
MLMFRLRIVPRDPSLPLPLHVTFAHSVHDACRPRQVSDPTRVLHSPRHLLLGRFVNPLLYQAAQADPLSFNDITDGDNLCTESACPCPAGAAALSSPAGPHRQRVRSSESEDEAHPSITPSIHPSIHPSIYPCLRRPPRG